MTEAWQDKPCILGTSRQSRRVWKRLYGDPGDLWVLHRCPNLTCREPTHLYLGTAKDNHRDTVAAGHHSWQQPEIRARSTGFKGKQHTESTKDLIRQKNLGRHTLDETRARISVALQGTVMTPERRANISAAKRGRKIGPQSPEHVAKRMAAVRRAKEAKKDEP
jgi:hypothetical protein